MFLMIISSSLARIVIDIQLEKYVVDIHYCTWHVALDWRYNSQSLFTVWLKKIRIIYATLITIFSEEIIKINVFELLIHLLDSFDSYTNENKHRFDD